jgi:hypothetical protein
MFMPGTLLYPDPGMKFVQFPRIRNTLHPLFLPVTMIVRFLGAVLLIHRNREH